MHPPIDLPLGGSIGPRLRVRRLGARSFHDARALQERSAGSVAAGGDDELLFVGHPPVITLGRGSTPDQLLAPPAHLAGAGISVVEADRGGGSTFHGPGQIIGYPIVDLRRRGLGVRSYLRAVEEALIAVLRDLGVGAFPRSGLTGVWTGSGKVAAIGIAVRRGITRHGFALNVDPDLEGFAKIVPCGLAEPVTSLRELGCGNGPNGLTRRLAAALEISLEHASEQASKPVFRSTLRLAVAAGHEVPA